MAQIERTVLVTGGTTRLGLAIASALRARGWSVLTSSHRADAGADFVADFTRENAADELSAAVRARIGRGLNALVNNAGLFTGGAEAIHAVNVAAPRRLTELFAATCAPGGAVVNITDAKLRDTQTSQPSPYLTSKRDLMRATREDALRFAPAARVNAVAPGAVLAPTDVRVPAGRRLLTQRPTPEDVAAAVAFLLETPSLTGVILPVDAGQSLLTAPLPPPSYDRNPSR